jgi:hypothetical protein
MDWKGILEKIIIAVAAGAILAAGGLLFATISSPRAQPVVASVTWIDVPNPFFPAKDKVVLDVSKLMQDTFHTADAIYSLDAFANRPELRIGKVNIQNEGDLKSKEIFISIDGAMLFSAGAIDQPGKVRSKLALTPLLPGKSATVFFVEKQWPIPTDVSLVHDDRIVRVETAQWPDELEWAGAVIMRFPGVIFAIFGAGFFIIVFLILGALWALLVRDKLAWRVKHTTPELVAKEVKFINYVRSNYPEKMPKGETNADTAPRT